MKMRIESTNEVAVYNGVPVRLWRGTTDTGVAAHLFIAAIAVDADDISEMGELTEISPPPGASAVLAFGTSSVRALAALGEAALPLVAAGPVAEACRAAATGSPRAPEAVLEILGVGGDRPVSQAIERAAELLARMAVALRVAGHPHVADEALESAVALGALLTGPVEDDSGGEDGTLPAN